MHFEHSIRNTVLALAVLLSPMAFGQGGNAPRAPVAHPATNPNCSLAPTPGVAFSTVVGTSWVYHWETAGSGLLDPAAAVGNMSFIQVSDPNSQSGEAGFINVIETRNVEFGTMCFSTGISHDSTANCESTSASALPGKSIKTVSSNNRGAAPKSLNGVAGTQGGIFRFLNYVGRFQIFSDCTGGTLMFNTGVGPVNFDFYFRKLNGDPFGALDMVGTDTNAETSFGEAEKQGPS